MPRKKCKLDRYRKHRAYGQRKKGVHWCPCCDLHLTPDVNKSSERQRAKNEIERELYELIPEEQEQERREQIIEYMSYYDYD